MRGEGARSHPPLPRINRNTALSAAFSEAITMFGSIPTPWTDPRRVLDLDVARRGGVGAAADRVLVVVEEREVDA